MAGSGPTDPDPPPDPDQIITLIQTEAAWRNDLLDVSGQALSLAVKEGAWQTSTDVDHKIEFSTYMLLANATMLQGSNTFRSGTTVYSLVSSSREGVRWATPSPT